MITLNKTEIDGVRCFWVDSERPTLNASLVFRAGLIDETFTTHGWHHLVEHSALHGRGGGALAINGSVTLTTTSFDCHGPVDMVAAHLGAVTSWIADPDLTDIQREVRVLAAEQRTRPWNPTAEAMLWRYGAQGPGLSAVDEYGLTHASPTALSGLMANSFHQGNAVIVLDGPPPSTLSLHLAADPGNGPHQMPIAVPCQAGHPARYLSPDLVLSGTADRSVAAWMLPSILQTQLRKKFRDHAGAAYAPWSVYEAVDAGTSVILAGTDVSDEVAPESLLRATEIIARTAESGAEEQDLQDLTAQIIQSLNDPYNSAGFAWRAGRRALEGQDPETPEEVICGIEAITADEIAAAATSFHQTLLIGAPEKAEAVPTVNQIRRPPADPVTGQRFRSTDWPLDVSVLTIGESRISATGDSGGFSIDYADLVGVIRYPRGKRVLVAHDSWNMTLEPEQWAKGDRAITLIDEQLPDRLVVDSVPGDEYTPYQRLPAWQRWRYGLGKVWAARTYTLLEFVVMSVIGGLCIALAIVIDVPGFFILGGVLIGRGLYDLVRNVPPKEAPTESPDLRQFRDS